MFCSSTKKFPYIGSQPTLRNWDREKNQLKQMACGNGLQPSREKINK